jgi:hypothetical protein
MTATQADIELADTTKTKAPELTKHAVAHVV